MCTLCVGCALCVLAHYLDWREAMQLLYFSPLHAVAAVVRRSGLSHRGRRFLEFDSLTLVPIQARLIDASLLTRQVSLRKVGSACRGFRSHVETPVSELACWLRNTLSS